MMNKCDIGSSAGDIILYIALIRYSMNKIGKQNFKLPH